MLSSESNKRVTIDFPTEIYRMAKAFTAFNELSIREFVVNAVSRELTRNKVNIPNEETLKTFAKTDKGKGLKHYESFDSLLLDLKKKKKI